MRLHVNKEGIIKSYINILTEELTQAAIGFESDIKREMGSLGKKHGETDIEIKRLQDRIAIMLKVNRAFLADNYGTGSLMDVNNPRFF